MLEFIKHGMTTMSIFFFLSFTKATTRSEEQHVKFVNHRGGFDLVSRSFKPVMAELVKINSLMYTEKTDFDL